MGDVKLLIAAADIAGLEGKKIQNASLVQLFRALRKSKIQRPDLITKYGRQVMKSGAVSGIEEWSLYEQIYIAALECGDIKLVDECSKRLNKQFPDSIRVKRLLGMQYEYNKEYKAALDLYNSLLTTNPSNLLILKRKVCVHKAKGDLTAAAIEIHKILKMTYSDSSLWLELSDIHLSMGDYQAASFCLEELVLLDPHNAILNTRLADVYCSLGGFENLLKARKHYTLSLNLQCARLNRRALYGLISTAKALADLTAVGKEPGAVVTKGQGQGQAACFDAQDAAVNKELLAWGRDQLAAVFSNTPQGKGGLTAAIISVL